MTAKVLQFCECETIQNDALLREREHNKTVTEYILLAIRWIEMGHPDHALGVLKKTVGAE